MAYLTTDRVPRTLILCFDGTSDAFDDDVTNVVRLFSAFEKEDPHRQLCYYQPGIGTYLGPNRPWSSTLQRIVKVVDQALACYLDDHVMGGYRFLMENYVKGDRICMFGFSRGAYTARCLAGMLHKVGLLPRSNEEHISFAYAKYSDTSEGNNIRASEFKETFSMAVEVAFVGVWDTVASCGLIGRNLPFTASNHIIRVFRHALALDERRSKFKPNPWHRTAHSPQAAANDPNQDTPISPPFDKGPHNVETLNDRWRKTKPKHRILSVDTAACDFTQTNLECDVREVWFPGCHADVGGGSVKTDQEHCLANASLVWMVNHIISANVGIIFKHKAFIGSAYKGIKPVFRSGTPLPDTIDPVSPHDVASPISLGEPTILLEMAEGNTSEIDITNSEPESPRRVFPGKKPTITFVNMSQEISKHERAPPRAPSRKKRFSSSLTVFSAEDPTTLPPGPPPPSSPPPTTSSSDSSPISPTIGSVRNGVIFTVDGKTVPILLAPKDPRSGEPISDTDPPTLALGLEQVDRDKDANVDMVDQLRKKKIWWFLEFIPLWQHYQDRNAYWHKGFRMNRGRARDVSDPEPLFHSSVKRREGYTPKARVRGLKPEYVNF